MEVLRPHTPIDVDGFHDDQLPVLAPLLADGSPSGIDDCVVWLNTPMALPLLTDLEPRAVVYDCMDQLAAFETAPRQMRQRETALLKVRGPRPGAGPSLYEDKRALHPNVMCLPSAVDAGHYARGRRRGARRGDGVRARLQGHVARPRLGFFGVIDERIDLGLLARLADAEPAWQIVMVGPVVRIDPQRCRCAPNIHWLGQQPYDVLPQLVAGWDVCLMPFALNDATRFISPTKTLEYMAAGKPVVSTALHDVHALFGDIVTIADDGDAFIEGCRDALAESPHRVPIASPRCRPAPGVIPGTTRPKRCTVRSRKSSCAPARVSGGGRCRRAAPTAGIAVAGMDAANAPPMPMPATVASAA